MMLRPPVLDGARWGNVYLVSLIVMRMSRFAVICPSKQRTGRRLTKNGRLFPALTACRRQPPDLIVIPVEDRADDGHRRLYRGSVLEELALEAAAQRVSIRKRSTHEASRSRAG